MTNGCHLVTLQLDTALIDDVGRGGVVGEVVLPSQVRAGPAGMPWMSSSGGGPVLVELACPTREAFLLVVSCFSGLILVLLMCMLVLLSSWFLVLWFGLEPRSYSRACAQSGQQTQDSLH